MAGIAERRPTFSEAIESELADRLAHFFEKDRQEIENAIRKAFHVSYGPDLWLLLSKVLVREVHQIEAEWSSRRLRAGVSS